MTHAQPIQLAYGIEPLFPLSCSCSICVPSSFTFFSVFFFFRCLSLSLSFSFSCCLYSPLRNFAPSSSQMDLQNCISKAINVLVTGNRRCCILECEECEDEHERLFYRCKVEED